MNMSWSHLPKKVCPECLGEMRAHEGMSEHFAKPVMVCRECDYRYNDIDVVLGSPPLGVLRVSFGVEVELCCPMCMAAGMRPPPPLSPFDDMWICQWCHGYAMRPIEVLIGEIPREQVFAR